MKYIKTVNCPYCGSVSKFKTKKKYGWKICECYASEYSCGGTFAVEYALNPAPTEVRRIEGEGKCEKEWNNEPTGNKTKFADIYPGQHLSYGGIEWVKLNENGLCLSVKLIREKSFDERDGNNWTTATIRDYLNNEGYGFMRELLISGAKMSDMQVITSDLTADDGTRGCGTAPDYVALLTCDLYRMYRDLIPPVDNYCWTLTPLSCHKDYSHLVRFIHAPSGAISHTGARSGFKGIRPLVSLKSDTLVQGV